MKLAIATITIWIVGAGNAHADTAAELVARGETLAKDRHYSEAIDAFKAADRIERRARHACLIALAYTRRELWPQAEIWRDTCQKRATPADPLPEWFAAMTTQIAERLATANAAAVDIRVVPEAAGATLSLSSLSPDETFEPRTIHLPPGHYVITARAAGYAPAQLQVDIADKTDRRVEIALTRPVAAERRPSALLYTGAALGVAGAATAGWMSYEWFASRRSFDAWGEHIGRYRIARWTTIGLWSAGAACAITGVVLRRRSAETPTVTVVPLAHGGMLAVGWQR
jgi:hypothetical protein